MSDTKYSYDKAMIGKKNLDINSGIEKIISSICSERFFVGWYGAYDIDPKHLVYWICVQTDRMKNELNSNIELNRSFRSLLETNQYPVESRQFVYIGFELQETVDRESKGNWYHHFK